MTTCSKCGGTMLGDGYTTPFHCEFADESKYELTEPDAPPVECDFEEDTEDGSDLHT